MPTSPKPSRVVKVEEKAHTNHQQPAQRCTVSIFSSIYIYTTSLRLHNKIHTLFKVDPLTNTNHSTPPLQCKFFDPRRATFHDVAGRIWPAGRTFDTTGLGCVENHGVYKHLAKFFEQLVCWINLLETLSRMKQFCCIKLRGNSSPSNGQEIVPMRRASEAA